jgi:putative oxidoreductase
MALPAFFRRVLSTSATSTDLGLLVLRLWFGLVLALGHGYAKMVDLPKFIESVGNRGIALPGLFGPAAALSEFVGGLLLAFGLLTRPAALFVLTTMLVAAFHVHLNDPFQKKEFALAYGIAALAVLLAGPGAHSLDARWLRRTKARSS